MQDRVRAAGRRAEADPPRGGVEQGQDLGRPGAHVLVRLGGGAALRPPAAARMRHGLEGAGLVLAPDRQPPPSPPLVGVLDQLFFAAASGAVTVTAPPRPRRRRTTPVSHHVRVFCQLSPAAWSVCQIVYVLTVGRPSPARRKAARSVLSDHVAVPSRSRSGTRAASAKMRRCSSSA